jgi:hypothetical protein
VNFTFSVTVRPREPLSSQCRHTFSISQWLQFREHGVEFDKSGPESIFCAHRFASSESGSMIGVCSAQILQICCETAL